MNHGTRVMFATIFLVALLEAGCGIGAFGRDAEETNTVRQDVLYIADRDVVDNIKDRDDLAKLVLQDSIFSMEIAENIILISKIDNRYIDDELLRKNLEIIIHWMPNQERLSRSQLEVESIPVPLRDGILTINAICKLPIDEGGFSESVRIAFTGKEVNALTLCKSMAVMLAVHGYEIGKAGEGLRIE